MSASSVFNKLSEPEANLLARDIADLIGLRDWRIQVRIMPAYSMGEALGTCGAHCSVRAANITLLDPDDFAPNSCWHGYDMIQVLIHEVLHCWTEQQFHSTDPDEYEEKYHLATEQMTDAIAMGIASLYKPATVN